MSTSDLPATSPGLRRSARARRPPVTSVDWTVQIDALSPELLDRVLAGVVEEHKGPASRRILHDLSSVCRHWADAASRRLWRRIVVDYSRKRSGVIVRAFNAQPHHRDDVRRVLFRRDAVALTPAQTADICGIMTRTPRLVELAVECRLAPLSEDTERALASALPHMPLERLRIEPPILDEDRRPDRIPRKERLSPAFAASFAAWTHLTSLVLWQVRLVDVVSDTLPRYHLHTLSLRDVDLSSRMLAHVAPSEAVNTLLRLTLEYVRPLDRADEDERQAFGARLAKLVVDASTKLVSLLLMSPADVFDGDGTMTAALRGLPCTLHALALGGDGFEIHHWQALPDLPSLADLELSFLRNIPAATIAASLELPTRWPQLATLNIRRDEFQARTAANALPQDARWAWPKIPLRRLRHACLDRGIETFRIDARFTLPNEAYTTEEESESDDAGPIEDGEALFELGASDVEDLEQERARDLEIVAQMRARESSEGDEFLASDTDAY